MSNMKGGAVVVVRLLLLSAMVGLLSFWSPSGCPASFLAEAKTYSVTAMRTSNRPIISSQNGQSSFTYNYNAAYVPIEHAHSTTHALLVRCQNFTGGKLGPSELSLTTQQGASQWQTITENNVVFKPSVPWENFGTEDPRVAYRKKTGEYFMFYTAVQTYSGGLIARLSLATTTNPASASSWSRHGPLFPDLNNFQFTKSGALMIRENDGFSGPSYLIFGDSTQIPGLQIATTTNLYNYSVIAGIYLPVRENSFDSMLVEAGPPPMLLSDGNYLFIYNSARKNESSPDHFEYNIGWAIINGTDPLNIIQRSDVPLLSPQLPWEVGTNPYLSLTPNVVFCEGMRADERAADSFYIYYGAADSVVGEAKVSVSWS